MRFLMFTYVLFSFASCSGSLKAKASEKENLSNDMLLKVVPRKTKKGPKKVIKKKNSSNFSSSNSHLNGLKKLILETPSGDKVKTYLALSVADQTRGLSKIRQHEFSTDEAMLFYYLKNEPRSFWMPDTYFNLDIFFLDKDMRVLSVERNVPHHPGRSQTPPIYSTGTYNCRHVLELKHSKKSAQIVQGMKLIWSSLPSQSQIEQVVRQMR